MPDIRPLGSLQLQVLASVARLRHQAYGMAIRRDLIESSGRDLSIGALYTTLERLEKKGYLSSWEGDPTPERGGRAKRFFRIEGCGLEALNQSRDAMTRLWPDLVPEGV